MLAFHHSQTPFLGTISNTNGTVVEPAAYGSNTHRSITFLQSGTLTINTNTLPLICDILVLGGGGSGGHGGGGAGGMLVKTDFALPQGVYTITVGAGGPGSVSNTNNPGDDSSITKSNFDSLIADGGGAGHSVGEDNNYYLSRRGFNGGGNYGADSPVLAAISGASLGTDGNVQGYYGGTGGGGTGNTFTKGGGGGGASANGIDLNHTSTNTTAPHGGAGLTNTFRTGTSGTTVATHQFAGGGGGGGNAGTYGTGTYGGGNGAYNSDNRPGAGSGTANSGAGGGGTYNNNAGWYGGNGGSGIVVIRYKVNQIA